jgi:hypothetical protein
MAQNSQKGAACISRNRPLSAASESRAGRPAGKDSYDPEAWKHWPRKVTGHENPMQGGALVAPNAENFEEGLKCFLS